MKELEERGIGRPSTYASVIETITHDATTSGRRAARSCPSWTAFAKVQLLERYFAHLVDYDFTATMEEALDGIARGEGEVEKWLHSFYFGNGSAACGSSSARSTSPRSTRARSTRSTIGTDDEGRDDRRAGRASRRVPRAR